MDRAYLKWFDKCLLDRASLEEDSKILTVVGVLTLNTDIWKDLHQQWLDTYVEFKEREAKIITMHQGCSRCFS